MDTPKFGSDKERMDYIEEQIRYTLDNLDAAGTVLKYNIEKEDDIITCVAVEVASVYDVVEVESILQTSLIELCQYTELSDEVWNESLNTDVGNRDTDMGRFILDSHGML